MTAKSVALFVVAAVSEIGGAYLMWQAIKEHQGAALRHCRRGRTWLIMYAPRGA